MALYYCMVIAFFLFETFKEDVLEEVIPITSYASTVRRNIIDIACKIVKTGHGIILKTSQAVMNTFKIDPALGQVPESSSNPFVAFYGLITNSNRLC